MFKKSLVAAALIAGSTILGTGVASAEPATTFESGTYVVGVDIAPGTYAAANVDNCYWERLSGLSGEFDDIIANDFMGEDGGTAIVTIKSSDVAFNSNRCGTWTLRQAAPAPRPAPAPAPAPSQVPPLWTGSAGF